MLNLREALKTWGAQRLVNVTNQSFDAELVEVVFDPDGFIQVSVTTLQGVSISLDFSINEIRSLESFLGQVIDAAGGVLTR